MNKLVKSDIYIMKRMIWRKTYPDGDTIVLAKGGDGPLWVSITPYGVDPRIGIDIDLVSNEPDAVSLKDIYDYYRAQDMTRQEWKRTIRAKAFETKYTNLLTDVKGVLQGLSMYLTDIPPKLSIRKDRIWVDATNGTVVVDETRFSGIDYESCLILKVIVGAGGNWVSRSEMQKSEPHLLDVGRIDRKINHLQDNHKAVGSLIERSRKGFRIDPNMFR